MNLTDATLLPLLGVTVYIALQQLAVLARRPEAEFRSRALWSALASVFLLARYFQYGTEPAVQIWSFRIQYTAALLLIPVMLAFLRTARNQRGFPVLITFGVALALAPLAGDWMLVGDLVVHEDWFGRAVPALRYGPLAYLIAPYVLAALVFLIRTGRPVAKADPARSPMLTVVPAIMALAGVNDVLMNQGLIRSVQMLEYGLLAFAVGTSYVFVTRAHNQREDLEREVAARTTELKSRGERLSEAVAALRALVEALPDPIFVFRGGRFVLLNRSALAYFGVSDGDLEGEPIDRVLTQNDTAAEQLRQIEDASRPLAPSEVRFVNAAGDLLTGEVVGLAFEFEGEPAALAIVRDMTERKQIQDRLLRSERLASVGTLAAGVAHEINNPLSYVLTNARVALESAEDQSDESRTMLEEIVRGGERIQRIVGDLKTLSRGDEERVVATDLASLLERVAGICENEIRHRARLIREIGPLPKVAANEARLEQVFLNLLVNATHAVPDGRADRNTISIRGRASREFVEIEIEDTGCGIPKDALARVFDPFYTTKPIGQGTGLGLSISQSIVEKFGGTLELESRAGRGTTARIRLPVADASLQSEAPPFRASPVPRRPRRVLIIDDDAIVGRSLKRVLRGHEVTICTSGVDALALCEAERFDVILCDVMMPDMNGMQVWEELRRLDGLERRVLFLTGGAFTPQAAKFLESVPNPCLTKPVTPDELRNAVADLARNLDPRDELEEATA